jgi:hypothetical protein
MFWRGVWCGAFAGMALRSREAVVYRRVATRFCQLGRFFARSISFVRRSSHVFPPKTPRARRANRDDKIAPRHAKPFLEISKWRAESIRVARNPSFWVDFIRFASVGFFPFKRAIPRNRRPVNRREKRGSKKLGRPIVFSDREIQRNLRFDLAFTARLGWRVTANELTPFRIRFSWVIGEESEKCFSLHLASRVPIAIPAHTPLSYTTPNNNNGLHCLHLHRLRRRPQGVQGPGTSRDARARACVRIPTRPHARSFGKLSRTRATRTRARGPSAARARSVTRGGSARRITCARSRPSRALFLATATSARANAGTGGLRNSRTPATAREKPIARRTSGD